MFVYKISQNCQEMVSSHVVFLCNSCCCKSVLVIVPLNIHKVTWNHQASLNLADTIQLILHSMHSQITQKTWNSTVNEKYGTNQS